MTSTPSEIKARFKQMGAILVSELKGQLVTVSTGHSFVVHQPWHELREEMDRKRVELGVVPLSQQPAHKLAYYEVNTATVPVLSADGQDVIGAAVNGGSKLVCRFRPDLKAEEEADSRKEAVKEKAKAKAQTAKGRILKSLGRMKHTLSAKPRFVVDRVALHGAPALRTFESSKQ